MADTVLVFQNLWQLHTNLSARKRHTERTKSFFVCSLHSEADKEHSMDHSRPRVAGWGRVLSVILSLSWLWEGLWHAPLPLTSWLAGGMLPWRSPLRSCCSHSHLLLLHLVLQELQLYGAGERWENKYQSGSWCVTTSNVMHSFISGSNVCVSICSVEHSNWSSEF